MHIQRTKTLDRAFGFAPKTTTGYNNYTDLGWKSTQLEATSKEKQPITNNLYQTVSLPLEVFIQLNQSELSWYKLAGKSSDEFPPLNVKGVKVTFFIYLYIYKIKKKNKTAQTEIMKKKIVR